MHFCSHIIMCRRISIYVSKYLNILTVFEVCLLPAWQASNYSIHQHIDAFGSSESARYFRRIHEY